jgi:transcriptional regulator NrdR family protein
MECPRCGGRKSKVTLTRKQGAVVNRTRKCLTCGTNFHSREHVINASHTTNSRLVAQSTK